MEFGTSNRVIQKLIYSIRCYRRLCTLQYSENRINILVLDDDPDIVSILKLGLMRQLKLRQRNLAYQTVPPDDEYGCKIIILH